MFILYRSVKSRQVKWERECGVCLLTRRHSEISHHTVCARAICWRIEERGGEGGSDIEGPETTEKRERGEEGGIE